jgi:thiamine pyrophosphokinase
MIIKIFTGPNNYDIPSLYNKEDDEFIIGVDVGAYLLAKNDIKIDLSVGDFDSVNKNQYELIKKYSKEIKKFEEKKNFTDTYLALQTALLMDHNEIVIYGGTGGRFDHEFANMNLLKLGRISIVSNDIMMYMLDPGSYEIENKFKYISFFAIEDVSKLSLKGFKYELNNINLSTEDPLCISNELEGSLSFKEGLLLIVHQNE